MACFHRHVIFPPNLLSLALISGIFSIGDLGSCHSLFILTRIYFSQILQSCLLCYVSRVAATNYYKPWKCGHLESQEDPYWGSESANTLILDFTASRILVNTCLLFKPCNLWCFVNGHLGWLGQERSTICLFQLMVTVSIPWLATASLLSLPWSSHHLLLCVSLSLPFCLKSPSAFLLQRQVSLNLVLT